MASANLLREVIASVSESRYEQAKNQLSGTKYLTRQTRDILLKVLRALEPSCQPREQADIERFKNALSLTTTWVNNELRSEILRFLEVKLTPRQDLLKKTIEDEKPSSSDEDSTTSDESDHIIHQFQKMNMGTDQEISAVTLCARATYRYWLSGEGKHDFNILVKECGGQKWAEAGGEADIVDIVGTTDEVVFLETLREKLAKLKRSGGLAAPFNTRLFEPEVFIKRHVRYIRVAQDVGPANAELLQAGAFLPKVLR